MIPDDHPLILTDEEIDALTPDEFAVWRTAVEQELSSWSLTPRQQWADDLANRVDELLYGGAAGGGKTEWALHRAWRLSLEHPGHRTIILRRSYPELERTMIERALERFDHGQAKYHSVKRQWRFTNGSIIDFGHLEQDIDKYRYQGAEYEMIVFDELTQFAEGQYLYLRSRLRTTADRRKSGVHPHIICMTNPGGVGHRWVKDRFIIPTGYGEYITETDDGDGSSHTVAFVPAKVSDNPHMDAGYVSMLRGLDDVERRQLLDGDWDVFSGQYFPEFSHEKHVVSPFEVPAAWTRVRGLDYGYANPAACLWIAWDWDDVAWVYKEFYGKHMTPPEQAAEIHRINDGDKIDMTMADPSIFSRTGAGLPIAAQYRDHGLIVRPANNTRIDGWAIVREGLRLAPDGLPRLRIFNQCENLVRQIPNQLHSDSNPEDLLKNDDDHAMDALRYGLMVKARKSRKPKTETGGRIAEHLRRIEKSAKRQKRTPVLGNW